MIEVTEHDGIVMLVGLHAIKMVRPHVNDGAVLIFTGGDSKEVRQSVQEVARRASAWQASSNPLREEIDK